MPIIDTRIILFFIALAFVQPFIWPPSINDIPGQIKPDKNTRYVTKKNARSAVTNPLSSILVGTTPSRHDQHKKSKAINGAQPKATMKNNLTQPTVATTLADKMSSTISKYVPYYPYYTENDFVLPNYVEYSDVLDMFKGGVQPTIYIMSSELKNKKTGSPGEQAVEYGLYKIKPTLFRIRRHLSLSEERAIDAMMHLVLSYIFWRLPPYIKLIYSLCIDWS